MSEHHQTEALDGIDASFLYAESATVPMQTLKVAIFEPGSAQDFDFKAICEAVATTAERLGPLRRRLVWVPGRLHHPRWIDVEKLDVEAHVEHVELRSEAGAAAGPDALERLVAETAERRLPRSRPLWRLCVITGLHQDRLAAIVTVHHSLADGGAALGLLNALSQTSPGEWQPPARRGRPLDTRRPGRMWLVWQAIWLRLCSLATLPKLIWTTLQGLARARWRGRTKLAKLFSGPLTFFNRKLGRTREYTHVELPLAELRAIKDAFDVSINDILLALISGAAARLREAGELRGPSLICSMPIGIAAGDGARQPGGEERREPSGPRLQGNRVANAVVELHDDLNDPKERVRAIAASTRAAKLNHELRGPGRLVTWAEFDAPMWERLAWFVVRRIKRPPLNLIVSNMRGPGQPIYLGRTRVDQLWSVGPLVDRVGLNLTAWSYTGTMVLSLLADGSQWTHATLMGLRAGLEAEHARLLGLVRADELPRAALHGLLVRPVQLRSGS